ncbi:MAG: hypothetical protein B7Z20_05235 [Sphingobium sp. 32-64-5]|nr:MAG: hypothetical protein B7Z20_05235 [Sphingobium sp. 32-64-5]
MTAHIYQTPKNAMQSGKARTGTWVLEHAPAEAKQPDPLTGWAGSGDMRQQLRLTFPSLEAAQAYASAISSLTSIAKPSARRAATKSATPFTGTRWTVIFSPSTPPPSCTRERPVARNSEKLSDTMPGEL